FFQGKYDNDLYSITSVTSESSRSKSGSRSPALAPNQIKTIVVDGNPADWSDADLVCTAPVLDNASWLCGAHHEPQFDYTALYMAYDLNNLYIGIQISDVRDVADPANAGSGDKPYTMNLPQWVALDVIDGKGYSGVNAQGMNSGEYDAWHKGQLFGGQNKPDYMIYFASNFWQGPFLYPYENNGASKWQPDAFRYTKTDGLQGKSGAGAREMILRTKDGAVFGTQNHAWNSRDSFFEIAVPLSLIGNPNPQTVKIMVGHGDGDMQSGIDCIPADSTNYNTTGATDYNSPLEWGDIDIFTVPFASIGGSSGIVDTGIVSGIVTDAVSGTQLSGVSVTIGSLTTLSDINGYYIFINAPVGEKTVIASKSGYITSASSVTVQKNITSSINLSLTIDAAPPKGPGFKFVSSDGLIEKIIRLADNSDVLTADYKENVSGNLNIRFGLSPNLNDMMINGKTNLEIVGGIAGSSYGLRNSNGGQAIITFRGAQYNSVFSDGTEGNYLLPLTKTIELTGNGEFSFNFTINNGSFSDDTSAPSSPTGIIADAGIGQAVIRWTANAEQDLSGYNVYRSQTSGSGFVKINGPLLTSLQFTNYALQLNQTYYYVVTAVDKAGNESVFSVQIGITITQTPPPAAPRDLSVSAGNGKITLTWTANSELDISGYNVYRSLTSGSGFVKINSSLILQNNFTDTAIVNGTKYYYNISAVNTQLQESSKSAEINATPVNSIAVTFNIDMTNQSGFTSVQIAGDLLTPSWSALQNQMTNTGNNIWTKTINLIEGSFLQYKYVKDNGAWEQDFLTTSKNRELNVINQNAGTMIVSNRWAVVGDLPPQTPGNFNLQALNNSVRISWSANTESDLKGYILERSIVSGSGYEQIGGLLTTSTYTDNSAVNGTRYYYRLKAVDNSDQYSQYTTEKSVVPDANPAPASPVGLIAYGKDGAIDLVWTANIESDLSGYNIYRSTDGINFNKINSNIVVSTNYTDNGLTNNTTYYYKLKAQNSIARESEFSYPSNAVPRQRQTSDKMYFAYHWHQHQPIYWPYENIVNTAGNPKNTTPVLDVLTWPDRINSYTHLPIDFVSQKVAYEGSPWKNAGVQISYSGSLIENLNNLSSSGIGYGGDWMNTYKWAHENFKTEKNNTRVDMVLFGYHHPLMPFIEYDDLRLQIKMHKRVIQRTFGDPVSKGMFPPENAFSLSMIPGLVDEGVQWVMIDNAHIDHCNKNYPWQSGEKINPANKADQLNPVQSKYVRLNCETNTSNDVSAVGLRPHWVQWVNPNTGEIKRIIGVPTERSIGYNDSYGDRNPPSMMGNLWQLNDDNSHPLLIVAAHDGDNAGASGNRYYLESCTPGSGDIELITIQDYLDMFPPDANDVVQVEQGCWVGADLGNSELHKWIGDPYYSGKVDFTNGTSSDWNSWAVMTAARNRMATMQKISPYQSVDAVISGNGSISEKAWHHYLVGQTSCYWYWDGKEEWDDKPTMAANNAMVFADQVINSGQDQVGPTIFPLQRQPYNPGAEEAFIGMQPNNFDVWTFVYDVSGLKRVQLKYRIDDDGENPINDVANEIYAGGLGVGPWQTISMTAEDVKMSSKGLPPTYKAKRYFASVNGFKNTLIDYYVETEDNLGNIAKSEIFHVWVGGNEGPELVWSPKFPTERDTITITGSKAGKLHWGTNGWNLPSQNYWPQGTVAYSDGKSVE
ncbi:carboxypeptidase regulatory-like domain-containing protein, partial [Candidatus Dependentiae bacterium]|nr:carboxypeptidase regulatory-like domain-containing protein [Candidatus Dependentiae bacterium]